MRVQAYSPRRNFPGTALLFVCPPFCCPHGCIFSLYYLCFLPYNVARIVHALFIVHATGFSDMSDFGYPVSKKIRCWLWEGRGALHFFQVGFLINPLSQLCKAH